jgi:hypothetical protein
MLHLILLKRSIEVIKTGSGVVFFRIKRNNYFHENHNKPYFVLK